MNDADKPETSGITVSGITPKPVEVNIVGEAPVKRGRGRPSNAEKARRMAETLQAGGVATGGDAPRSVVDNQGDRDALKAVVESIVNGMDCAIVATVENKALKIADKPTATAIAQEAALRGYEKTSITVGAVLTMDKYRVGRKYLPEAMLVGGLAVYGGRVVMLLKKLDQIAAQQKTETPNAKRLDKPQGA